MILKIYYALMARWEKYRLSKLKFKHLGNNVRILRGFRLGHTYNLTINDNVIIGENAFINARGGVIIGSGTITGPDIMIFAENHIYNSSETLPFDNNYDFREVIIGENCWIGGKVFICPGAELGEGCVVAAGSVVTKKYPPLSIIAGNPAKIIKTRDLQLYAEAKKKGKLCNDLIKKL